MALICSQFCVSDKMFLMAILKVAALQKEGQLNYIKSLTTRNIILTPEDKKLSTKNE
jgi:hypothetical protein